MTGVAEPAPPAKSFQPIPAAPVCLSNSGVLCVPAYWRVGGSGGGRGSVSVPFLFPALAAAPRVIAAVQKATDRDPQVL